LGFFRSGPIAKWTTIVILSILLLAYVFKGKPTFGKNGKGYSWGLTGVLIGLLTVVAWEISSVFGGAPRGLAITTPLRELFNSMLTNSTHSSFQEFSFLGIFRGTWGVFFIFSVPFGAAISSLGLKEFQWKGASGKGGPYCILWKYPHGNRCGNCRWMQSGHGITGMSTGPLPVLLRSPRSSSATGRWSTSSL